LLQTSEAIEGQQAKLGSKQNWADLKLVDNSENSLK
jgi:hypothetical protein